MALHTHRFRPRNGPGTTRDCPCGAWEPGVLPRSLRDAYEHVRDIDGEAVIVIDRAARGERGEGRRSR